MIRYQQNHFTGGRSCCTSDAIYPPPGAWPPWAPALELGANTFQFFTRNPRGSRAKPLDEADAAALTALLQSHAFAPIIAHAPYTLNLCAAVEDRRTFARETLADDLDRMEHVPGQLYNLHPGSHVGQGPEAGAAWIAQALNTVLRPEQTTTVLLETMAGKGARWAAALRN